MQIRIAKSIFVFHNADLHYAIRICILKWKFELQNKNFQYEAHTFSSKIHTVYSKIHTFSYEMKTFYYEMKKSLTK
jgi:hypothetical protein